MKRYIMAATLAAASLPAFAGGFDFLEGGDTTTNNTYNTSAAAGAISGAAASTGPVTTTTGPVTVGGSNFRGGDVSQGVVVTDSGEQRYSGGYEVKQSGTTRVEMAPDIALSTPPSTAPCIVSYGGTLSTFWGGIGVNGFKQDIDCTAQSYYQTTYGRNLKLQGMTETLMVMRLERHIADEREDNPVVQQRQNRVRTTAGRPVAGAFLYTDAVKVCSRKGVRDYGDCMRNARTLLN